MLCIRCAEKEIMTSEDIVSEVNDLNGKEEYQSALDAVLPALSEAENDYALWIGAGNAYYGLKRFDEAERAYLKAAELESDDVVALSNLAGVYFETQRYETGLDICARALSRRSDYVNALIHQGNMLSALNRYEEAVSAYDKALAVSPDDLLTIFNLAYALVMTGRNDRAEQFYERLLKTAPDDEEYLFAYASFLEKQEKYEQAASVYLRLLQVRPDPVTHITLSGCLYNLQLQNKNEEVMRLTDEWLSLFPDNPAALHMLETLKNSKEVKRASAEYVQELFDAFAESFDSVLEGLNYQAPSLIADAVKGLTFSSLPETLDLGCGTGLCAAAMRSREINTASLTGVDLSAQMLKKAEQRKLYTALVQADILTYLPSKADCFDLVVSADVLTYLGDLAPVFSGLAKAVKSGGRVVLTVSENREDPSGYAMEPSGRFMHGKEYIRNELNKNGFNIEKTDSVELRQELGLPVYGLLIISDKI